MVDTTQPKAAVLVCTNGHLTIDLTIPQLLAIHEALTFRIAGNTDDLKPSRVTALYNAAEKLTEARAAL